MDIIKARKELLEGKTIYDMNLKVASYGRVSTDKDDQINSLGVNYINEEVIEVTKNNVKTKNNTYESKIIIVATGLRNRELGIEKDYIGKGVSYCATCDGNFFKNKDVLVVGGGNTAFQDVIYLSNIVNKVYLINRRNIFRADDILVKKVNVLNNVEIITPANLVKINGENFVSSIELDNGRVIDVDGIFIAIGKEPNTEMFKGLLELDESGYIKSDDTFTNIENIFVAGDVRTKDLRQLVTAASDGAIAATNAINYLNNN